MAFSENKNIKLKSERPNWKSQYQEKKKPQKTGTDTEKKIPNHPILICGKCI